MSKYEALLLDIEAILETVDEVNKVSHGKVPPLTSEETFTAVYITPMNDEFHLVKPGNTASAYDNISYIRILAHIDCSSDDLLWVATRRKLIDAILEDSPIWRNAYDRDILAIEHDDFDMHPLKAFEILFEFKLREPCIA